MARNYRKLRQRQKEEAIGANRAQECSTTWPIQRIAADSDRRRRVSVSTVPLPSDDMKGRIIGRQVATSAPWRSHPEWSLVVDDTPEAVLLSSFESSAAGDLAPGGMETS